MQSLGRLLIVVALAFVLSSYHVQAQCCPDPIPANASAQQMIACIKELRQQIGSVKGERGPTAKTFSAQISNATKGKNKQNLPLGKHTFCALASAVTYHHNQACG